MLVFGRTNPTISLAIIYETGNYLRIKLFFRSYHSLGSYSFVLPRVGHVLFQIRYQSLSRFKFDLGYQYK